LALDLSSIRPPGGKRSTKRDRILNVFLRQEGHVSADELVALVHRDAPASSRRTAIRDTFTSSAASVTARRSFSAPTSNR